jgi:putative SOS response-associated peptidase YedK
MVEGSRALRSPRHGETLRAMCNLCSITKGQQAIRDLAGAMRDLTGNLPMLPGVFPDYSAPIVRTAADGVRELAMARWGMRSPWSALKGRNSRFGRHERP